jgi:hypothetical protein
MVPTRPIAVAVITEQQTLLLDVGAVRVNIRGDLCYAHPSWSWVVSVGFVESS